MLSDFSNERQQFIIQEICKLRKFRHKSVLIPAEKNKYLIEHLKQIPVELIGITSAYKSKEEREDIFKYHFSNWHQLISAEVSLYEIIILDTSEGDLLQSLKHCFEMAPVNATIICPCYPDRIISGMDALSEHLCSVVNSFGSFEFNLFPGQDLVQEEEVFGFAVITKESTSYQEEFKGFYLDDEEAEEPQENGMIKYNAVRDMVTRYINSIKLYDQELVLAIQLNELLSPVTNEKLGYRAEKSNQRTLRREFKIQLQKKSWENIFKILNLQRFSTSQLQKDIEKFIQEQTGLPFTMRNILHMLQMVVGTVSERMDRAIVEAFDSLTMHHQDNRVGVPGWKSNSHYMVGKKFVIDYLCPQEDYYKGREAIHLRMGAGRIAQVDDITKALCLLTNERYEKLGDLYMWFMTPYKVVSDTKTYFLHDKPRSEAKVNELYNEGIRSEIVHSVPLYGEWFDFAFWRVKGFKKGTMHFEFKDEKIWRLFNKRVAEIKGYELHEFKEETAYQKRNTGKSDPLF